MKNIIYLLALVILLLINTNLTIAQWYQQNSGTSMGLNGVSFTDANNGIAVGGDYILGGASNSIILQTTNGGSTWITQSTGSEYSLFGVSFTDINNGTAVGNHATILRTKDGGSTCWHFWDSPRRTTLLVILFATSLRRHSLFQQAPCRQQSLPVTASSWTSCGVDPQDCGVMTSSSSAARARARLST